jgi:hypothetical protein
VIRSASLYHEGFVQRLIYWIDGLIHFLFLLFNPSQKARQIACMSWQHIPPPPLTEETFAKLRDEEDHYLVSLPMEIATGDGFRIGYEGTLPMSDRHLEQLSRRIMSHREVTHPRSQNGNRWS